MYTNPSRWAFAFQSYVQLTMVQHHTKPPSKEKIKIKMMERSLYSARNCFAENLRRTGQLSQVEFAVLAACMLAFAWLVDVTFTPALCARLRPERRAPAAD